MLKSSSSVFQLKSLIKFVEISNKMVGVLFEMSFKHANVIRQLTSASNNKVTYD